MFYSSKCLVFYPEQHQTLLSLFGQKREKKCQIFDFLKLLFLKARIACFPSRTAPNTFSEPIWPKKKGCINFKFLTKPWTNSFKKCQIFDFLTLLFLKDRMACFLSGTGYQTLFLNLFGQKRNDEEISKFFTKTRDFETMSDFRLPQIDVFK